MVTIEELRESREGAFERALKAFDKLEKYGIEYLSDNEKENLTPYL